MPILTIEDSIANLKRLLSENTHAIGCLQEDREKIESALTNAQYFKAKADKEAIEEQDFIERSGENYHVTVHQDKREVVI